MNTLEFEIHNQTLVRVDSQELLNKNKNIYKCIFTFDEDSEWLDLNKFVIFTDGWGNTVTQHLGNDSNILSCLIPSKVLKGSYFKITVYGGDLLTTNNISIGLIQSGYVEHRHKHHHHHCHDGKDIFVEIFDRLDSSVDSIFYDNNTLHLYNRDNLLESIYLPFLTKESISELVNDLANEFIQKLPVATGDTDGLLSKEDKNKLDSIEEGANHTIVDTRLNPNSNNAVSNKLVSDEISYLTDDINDVRNYTDDKIQTMEDTISLLKGELDNKEDVYDYVERLDNVIVNLINNGE